jgi:hypothetical protein
MENPVLLCFVLGVLSYPTFLFLRTQFYNQVLEIEVPLNKSFDAFKWFAFCFAFVVVAGFLLRESIATYIIWPVLFLFGFLLIPLLFQFLKFLKDYFAKSPNNMY